MTRVLTLDAGNTSVGAVLWRGNEMHSCLRLPNDADPAATLRALGPFDDALGVGAIGCEQVVGTLAGVRWVGRDVPLPGRVLYEDPDEMGRDRRVVCHGAHAVFGVCLVVDCGTCLTLTHVDADEALRGLAISVGLGTLRRGLAGAAPALARFVGAEVPAGVPRGTADNLAVGLDLGWRWLMRALVDEAVRRLRGEGLEPGCIVFTGSDGHDAHGAYGRGVHAPSLVHRGLWRLLACRESGC